MTAPGTSHATGQQELERDALLELRVARRDDDAHAARAEHPLDLELAGEDLARLHWRRAGACRAVEARRAYRRGRPHRGSTRPRRSGPGGRSSRSSGSTGTPRERTLAEGVLAERLLGGPAPSSEGSTNDERATAETSCRHSSHVLMCCSAAARAAASSSGLLELPAFASCGATAEREDGLFVEALHFGSAE